MKRNKAILLGACLALVSTSPSHAIEYKFVPTPAYFVPYGINDYGTMVGVYRNDYAAILQDGVIEIFASYKYPSGINNNGDIILWNGSGSYLYDGEEIHTLDIPDSRHATANDINDDGTIVGIYHDYDYPWGRHAFIIKDDKFQSVDYPGYDGLNYHLTTFGAINNFDEVVGLSLADDGLEKFIYVDGVFTYNEEIGTFGINDVGQSIGSGKNDEGRTISGLWEAGIFQPINFSGAEQTSLQAINNLGQIAGYYKKEGDSTRYGFLVSPVVHVSVEYYPKKIILNKGKGKIHLSIENEDETFDYTEITSVSISQINSHEIHHIFPDDHYIYGDRDEDGIGDVTVKFNKADLMPYLVDGENVISISGELSNGIFLAGDVIAQCKSQPQHP
ncbi:MAG: hypothetical protein KQH63_04400 [Desulfobulbaceae bacterium]|nr:hypothetical protein [Desulfobulbaceae bacterium]